MADCQTPSQNSFHPERYVRRASCSTPHSRNETGPVDAISTSGRGPELPRRRQAMPLVETGTSTSIPWSKRIILHFWFNPSFHGFPGTGAAAVHLRPFHAHGSPMRKQTAFLKYIYFPQRATEQGLEAWKSRSNYRHRRKMSAGIRGTRRPDRLTRVSRLFSTMLMTASTRLTDSRAISTCDVSSPLRASIWSSRHPSAGDRVKDFRDSFIYPAIMCRPGAPQTPPRR